MMKKTLSNDTSTETFIIWTQRNRCKVVILLVLAIILLLDAPLFRENGENDRQTSTIGSSESFSLNWNTTREDLPLPHHVHDTFDTKFFENSRDVKDQPITMGRYNDDIPFFWAIPKSGTSTIKGILIQCLNLRMASSSSEIDYDSYDQIQVVNGGSGDGNSRGGHFVNVNFGYLPGIQKAQEWKMAESGLVDVAVTSYIHEGVTQVFDPKHPARIFTILRHPILRMISDFYYQKVATWEKTFDGSRDANLTLLEYASDSQYHVDNWVTRQLSNRHNGPVRGQDFVLAQRVLKEKMLILWLDEIDESIARLVAFMAWESRLQPPRSNSEQKEGLGSNACLDSYLHSNPANAHHDNRSKITVNSTEWQMLKDINQYDLNLYWYGKELFDGEQRELYNNLKVKLG